MHDEPASNKTPDSRTASDAPGPRPAPGFDFAALLDALVLRWRRVLAAGVLCFLAGLALALFLWRPVYVVTTQLARYEAPLVADEFTPRSLTTPTLLGLVTSPEVLATTGLGLTPPLSSDQVGARIKLAEDRVNGLVTVTATGRSAAAAASLAEAFSLATVRHTQAMQAREATEAGDLLGPQLADNTADRAEVRAQLAAIEDRRAADRQAAITAGPGTDGASPAETARGGLSRLAGKTQLAREELDDLRARYTDAHPLVREQLLRVTALEAQLSTALADEKPAAPGGGPSAPSLLAQDQSTGYDALALRLGLLETHRAALIDRQRVTRLFATQPPGYLRVLHSVSAGDAQARRSRLAIGVLALLCGALGALGAMASVVARELRDDRLKTDADVRRVTGLPILAVLGDLDAMSPAKRESWSLRTWTAFQHKMSVFPNRGLVCGFTSSGPGEGRSTWIKLIAQSARQCGFRVLVISSQPGAQDGLLEENAAPAADPADASDEAGASAWGTRAFTALVLKKPARLIEKLTAPEPLPLLHLPLPVGWIWDLERREQWQKSLNSWRAVENIVILVELPPVRDPETVLLAENIPNLVWLTESHKAEAAETLAQLETLRHARCKLAGAVLNRAPAARPGPGLSRRFGPRSAALAWAFGLLGAGGSAHGQETVVAPPPAALIAPAALSVVGPAQRAPWQEKLVLGPGDLLHLSVFGQPGLTQENVPVGPDGRVSFLEAQNVPAAGLTVDEFRAALNTELGKTRGAPEVIVIPAAYRSKKFHVLGAVVKKGSFALDRPMTVIEAVAEARGLETSLGEREVVVLADLSRSFIARRGEHLPVDFEKLFLEGDLSQNIALEPDDYLYFPVGERQEIFVLGEVRSPGTLAFNPRTTTLEAIAVRGGFSERAWRKRLLVIRGSLDKPQTFVVNAADVLSAKSADFQLQPRDIVYVGNRPWSRAVELLDMAAAAFVESAVVTATGLHVDPFGHR